MKILLDTNIVVDIISKRMPFFQESYDSFLKILKEKDIPYISSSSVTDIVYILRKYITDKTTLFNTVQTFLKLLEIEDTKRSTVEYAFNLKMKDYEDSVQLMIAKENNVGLILTRNTKDFVNSPIKVMEPKDYL